MDEQPLPDDLSTIKTSKILDARVEKRKRELGPEHPDTCQHEQLRLLLLETREMERG